jgi:pseudouridine synthase/RluA family pseudouridine synthase
MLDALGASGKAKRGDRPIRVSARDVLFEDEDYIAVAKRAGWLIHASVDRARPNLLDALRAYLRRRDHGVEGYLALHHRLDLWTSGVVLFARSERGSAALDQLFKTRAIRKIYCGLCTAPPPRPGGRLENFLKRERIAGKDRMVAVRSGGQKAISDYRLLDKRGDRYLLEFELVTGRMHQIRAQAAAAGFPLVGDALYGRPDPGLPGQLLHASRLEFDDPISKRHLVIEAPLPDSFGGKGAPSSGHRYLAFHKPYGVLCQFTPDRPGQACLADFSLPPQVYPVGRLDKDSEGLLLLTDDGRAAHRIASPTHKAPKTYWVQVEGVPDADALERLAAGVVIKSGKTLPCQVRVLEESEPLPPREPPIRVRKSIPTTWLEIVLREGKNRQIRRMTAAVGHPTLRLVRVAVGEIELLELGAGEVRELSRLEVQSLAG